MKSWNSVLNLLVKMKREYQALTQNRHNFDINEWVDVLDKEEYRTIFSNVKTTLYGNWVLIKYNLIQMYENQTADMWGSVDSLYREMRSIVVDMEKEELVLVPFKKFYNVNEVPSTALEVIQEKIRQGKTLEMMDKLDGSMISGGWYEGKTVLSSSSELDPARSTILADAYRLLTPQHEQLFLDFPYMTFNFELIVPKYNHMVMYQEERLVLIGMRDKHDGRQLPYSEIERLIQPYTIEMVEWEKTNLDEVLQQAKIFSAHEKEGWVLYIDGELIKLKCDDYVKVDYIMGNVSNYSIIKHIADETYDDFISKIPILYRPRIERFAKQVFAFSKQKRDTVQFWLNQAPKEDRKTFMTWVDQHVPKDCRAFVKNVYLGKSYHPLKKNELGDVQYIKANEMGIKEKVNGLFDF